LAKRGYEAMLDHYQKVAPHLNPGPRPGQACTAVYETAWFAQSEAEGYSGVRGAPRRYSAAGPPIRLGVVFLSVISSSVMVGSFFNCRVSCIRFLMLSEKLGRSCIQFIISSVTRFLSISHSCSHFSYFVKARGQGI